MQAPWGQGFMSSLRYLQSVGSLLVLNKHVLSDRMTFYRVDLSDPIPWGTSHTGVPVFRSFLPQRLGTDHLVQASLNPMCLCLPSS